MFVIATSARLSLSFVAFTLVASAALAQDAGGVLRRSSAAMGAAS